ncbi:MAG: class I SAM-dependent methyltransferase [Phycisphaerae bacterium]|nr:class I SAM-dependent methyltransferase [Phycisphaerae bacterium]
MPGRLLTRVRAPVCLLGLVLAGCAIAADNVGHDNPRRAEPSRTTLPAVPADAEQQRAAERMIRASRDVLAPVYAPLAEQITRKLRLADKTGIGIDVGSGPGDLIVELCKRTRLHWINADINPYFFGHFLDIARRQGVGHRVSAVYADAQALPFRDDYADVIVSRGSYHFWPDRKKGFQEVYRVLKPGGVAYVGRGFPDNLPPSVAQGIRQKQAGSVNYDRRKEADDLRRILDDIGIPGYRIHLPDPPDHSDLNYGLWVEFHKPNARP